MDKYRETIEIQKIINKFNENGYYVSVIHEPGEFNRVCFPYEYEYIIHKNEIYDFLKEKYFEIIKNGKTETISFDLNPETLDNIYKKADESGKLIDEVIEETLELYLNELKDLDYEINEKEMELHDLKSKRKKIFDNVKSEFELNDLDL